jgi:pyridoxamine 5'-phosphate oxidase
MTLATLGLDGFPAARTVLLSSVSPSGFRFHTDARSAKAAELAADSRAALVITYPELARQLVVQGRAVRQSDADGALAYEQRSAYLRQLAWINDAEHAQLADEDRRRAWSAAVSEVPDGPLAPPASWAGYEVIAHRYLFWEGGADRASHRTEYVRSGDGWVTAHLPG